MRAKRQLKSAKGERPCLLWTDPPSPSSVYMGASARKNCSSSIALFPIIPRTNNNLHFQYLHVNIPIRLFPLLRVQYQNCFQWLPDAVQWSQTFVWFLSLHLSLWEFSNQSMLNDCAIDKDKWLQDKSMFQQGTHLMYVIFVKLIDTFSRPCVLFPR